MSELATAKNIETQLVDDNSSEEAIDLNIDEYEQLNKKCDAVMSKIKSRKKVKKEKK